MLSLSGHVGAKAAALVDGQLSAEEEERAWAHVLGCPGCRRLVEREGWVKQRLGALSGPVGSGAEPSPALLGSLYTVDAWAQVDALEERGRRRRASAVVVGGGAVAASVLGLITVTGTPAGGLERPVRPSPATIRGADGTPGQGTRATPVGDRLSGRPAPLVAARPSAGASSPAGPLAPGTNTPLAWRHRAR